MEISGDFGPLRRQLSTFRDRAVEVRVTADIDKSSFARAEVAGGKLGGSEEVKLRADVDTSSFARARAAQAVLTKESSKLSDVFNRSNLSIGQWTGILAASLPVVVDLGGALGALTASLGAATAGVGALGVGLAGVATVGFGGIAAIAVPAIASLKDLMTAQSALNKSRSTGAISAASAASSATQQITTAENSLASAQRSEKVAQDALNTAREEAVRQLEDMKRAALESGTSEKRARLSLLQAEQNLRKLRKDGSASTLDVRDAELSVVEARQNVKDVSIQAQRAQSDYNKAQKGGISQMPQVVAAQRSYDDAVRATADANASLAQAQTDANTAAGAGATQLAALRLAQKKAGPAAVEFARNLKDFTQRWRRLTTEGRADFFGTLSDGLDRVNRRLPLLAKSAQTSMHALRDGFNQFLDRATGPEFNHFIDVMTRTFAKSLGPVAQGLGNIALILERIAVAVAPDIVKMARGFEDMTKGWRQSTGDASNLRDVIHDLVGQTKAWWDLLKQAGELIVAVLVPGMGQGEKAVKGMTDQLKEWTNWANAHPREIRDFMKEGLETTKLLAQTLLSFLPTLFEISKATRPIARAFLAILKGLNTIRIGDVSALTVVLGTLVGAKIVTGIKGLVGSITALRGALFGAAAAESALGASTVATTTAMEAQSVAAASNVSGGIPFAGMKAEQGAAGAAGGIPAIAGFGKASEASGVAKLTTRLAGFAKVAGGATLAVTALIGAFEALRTNFLGVQDAFKGFFNIVLKPVGDAFKDLVNTLTLGHGPEAIEAFGKALKVISGPLSFVVNNLTKLVGLLAIGAIATPLALAITAIAAPLIVATKGANLLVKALRHLGGVVKVVAKFIAGSWITAGVLTAPFRIGVPKALAIFVPMKRKVTEIAKAIGQSLRSVFDSAWDAVKDIFRRAAPAVGGIFGRMGQRIAKIAGGIRSVFTGLAKIIHKVADFIVHAVDRLVGALGSVKDKIGDVVPSLPSLPSIPDINPFQKGGVVPGTGVGDKIAASLPIGSGIINRKAANVLLEPRELAFMPDEVRKIGGPKVIERINKVIPRFQRGGIVDRTGVRHVPGFQRGGYVGMQPGIVKLMKTLIGRFGGFMASGLRPGDPGFHGRGLAGDWVGGDWLGASRYVNSIGASLLEGIHQAPPGQDVSWDSGHRVPPSFWGASTWAEHVSHIHVAIQKFGKGVAGALAQIGKFKIEGKGPVTDVAQGAAERMRDAANQMLAKLAPREGKESAISADGNVERIFAQVAKKLSTSKTATLALGEAGFAESGMRDLSFGDSTSQGALQLLASTAAGLGINPHDEGAIASAFFQRGFTGKGGANQLAAQGLPAHLVAQGVQGSAFPSGSNYLAQKANALAWMRRFGLKEGGIVAPFLGEFHEGGRVLRDGFGSLQRGEQVISRTEIPMLEEFKKLLRRLGRMSHVEHRPLTRRQIDDGRVAAPDTRLGQLRRRREELRAEIKDIRARDLDPKKERKLIKAIEGQIEATTELLAENKQLRREIHENNQRYGEIKASERAALSVLSGLVSRNQGQQQAALARQGAAGITKRL